MAMTPVGQFKLGCSGQLAHNVSAKVSSTVSLIATCVVHSELGCRVCVNAGNEV